MQAAKGPGLSPDRRHWLAAAVLAAVTLAAFARALDCGFVNFDDYLYVTKNRRVTDGLNAGGVSWAFTTFHAANWHPLTWLSLQLDASLSGGEPAARGFHRTNVLLHAANAALAFLALRALTRAFWRSAAAALLFAVHPLRVESVAWVAERKDVLSVCFGLLALWAYAAYARAPSARRYLAVTGLFVLSLLAKPTLVTLPCLFLVLDWWPLGRARSARDWGRLAIEKLPLFALAAASSAVTYVAQSERAVKGLQDYPLLVRVENAAVGYGAYFLKTAWPANLAVFYPHHVYSGDAGSTLLAQAVGAAALLLALTAGAVALRRRAPYVLAGWLWYLGTLVPVIGVVQVGVQAFADRYSYFPQLGLLIALCWAAADLARGRESRPALAAAAATAAAVLAAVTWNQLGYWRDSRTLWEHTLRVTGENPTALFNLGQTFEEQRQPEKAAELYRQALALNPSYVDARLNLGNILQRQGRVDDAETQFREVCRLSPGDASGYASLGNICLQRRNWDEAARLFETAARLEPESAEIRYNQGLAEDGRQNFDAAVAYYRKAVELRPGYARAHANLGVDLLRLKQSEGLSEIREAVHIDPAFAQGYHLLGIAFTERGEHQQAAEEFSKATRLRQDFAPSWYGLGVALAALGRLPDAADCLTRAAVLEPESESYRAKLAEVLDALASQGHPEFKQQAEDRLRQARGQPGRSP